MSPEDAGSTCPLCRRRASERFFEDARRVYLRCDGCGLVFVPERYWLSLEEEKAVYDLHRNDPVDPGYRRFVSRLSIPLVNRLGPSRQGLDFGCGPGPALSRILEEQGHRVALYDPFYHNDEGVVMKARTYDFICATEVVEHLRDPAHEFEALFNMLRADGWLGIMTKLLIDREAFRSWHYIRDPTHICFFSRTTFEYLARRFEADVEFVGKDVILLHKRP